MTETASSIQGPAFSESPDAPRNLTRALQRAAGGDRGIVYVDDPAITGLAISEQPYHGLYQEALAIAGGLRAAGCRPGDCVILQLADNRPLLTAFWGCILAGCVPLPLEATGGSGFQPDDAAASRLAAARQLLGDAPEIGSSSDVTESGYRLTLEALSRHAPLAEPYQAAADDLALLLLTSGSTGAAKAVRLTHRGLLMRSMATAHHTGFSIADVSLNWFALHHVGGLVMFHLYDLILGCRQIHVATELILARPLRWLELIHKHRVTSTWAPSFAFELINAALAADPTALQAWSLGCLRFITNAGEAIDAGAAGRFIDTLGAAGLPRTAMRPSWGMSEACSSITYSDRFTPAGDAPAGPVCVGTPIPGVSIRIVDQDDKILPQTERGRVQIRGHCITPGYYRNREADTAAFTEDGWFNTGDNGWLEDGQLTIAGRDKEIIIIRGGNHDPREIEMLLDATGWLEPGCTVACAVHPQASIGDKLAIFCVPSPAHAPPRSELLAGLRRRLVEAIGINPDYLIPLHRDQLPRTAIGKLQRSKLAGQLEGGAFDKLLAEQQNAAPEPDTGQPTTTERTIADCWSQTLGIESIAPAANPIQLGADSLSFARVQNCLQQCLGIKLPITELYRHTTVAALAGYIDGRLLGELPREAGVPETLAGHTDRRLPDALGGLDELSDAEIEALLKERLLKHHP